MRYETVVETTSDGQLVLRLVLVPDVPHVEDAEYNQEEKAIIIRPLEEDETPGVITWQM